MALGKNFRLIWNEALVKETVKRVAIEIIETGIKMIEIDAKILCPVDKGPLRASIHGEMDKSKLEGKTGTNMEYGPYVEFGTGRSAEEGKGKQSIQGQVPQPYMRPAYEKNIKQIMAMFKTTFK